MLKEVKLKICYNRHVLLVAVAKDNLLKFLCLKKEDFFYSSTEKDLWREREMFFIRVKRFNDLMIWWNDLIKMRICYEKWNRVDDYFLMGISFNKEW